MLVYRNDAESVDSKALLASMRVEVDRAGGAPAHDAVTAVLIDCGELEAAVADEFFPDRDGIHPVVDLMREASLRAARAFVASWRREPIGPHLRGLADVLDRLAWIDLPRTVMRRVSEGYAYYALHPETYAAAAFAWAAESRPAAVVCLGIRSIGTSLAAVVAAAVEATGVPVRSWTVRPQGHPFDRHAALAPDLTRALAVRADHAHFLVADEGPGMSGSSFAAVVGALENLGIPANRILLLPSWNADPSRFVSPRARAAWNSHRRLLVDAHSLGIGPWPVGVERAVDLSAGRWREQLIGSADEWPAVQPQHERIKALVEDGRTIVRYAGLGRYGAARFVLAERLADWTGAPPQSLERGYLALPFVPGRPCRVADADDGFIDRMADYLAFRCRHLPSRRTPSLDELADMIETNAREAGMIAGRRWPGDDRGLLEDAPASLIDGRMLPHEWIRTAGGYGKSDALDHAADHFFPGSQDAIWDVAAVEAEFRLDDRQVARLLARYTAAVPDPAAARRLPFYRAAYAAFQLGYAAMAAQSLDGSEDGRRFAVRRDRFAALLRAALR